MTGYSRRTVHGLLAAVLPALALGACTTTTSPVDVTRFHSNSVTRSGTVGIIPAERRDAGSLEFRSTAAAVATALGRLGYRVVDEGAASDYRAVVSMITETYQPERRRSPVSVGVGGSTGSYGSGLGVGIGIDLSGKPKPVVSRQLRVQIRRASDDSAVWEGRAETAAKEGSVAAQPAAAATRLADALFRDFPGRSGESVTVR